jgi:hypothetical protein
MVKNREGKQKQQNRERTEQDSDHKLRGAGQLNEVPRVRKPWQHPCTGVAEHLGCRDKAVAETEADPSDSPE